MLCFKLPQDAAQEVKKSFFKTVRSCDMETQHIIYMCMEPCEIGRKAIDNDIEYLGNGISGDLFFLSHIMWDFFPLYFYIFSVS